MVRFDDSLWRTLNAEGFPVNMVSDGLGPRGRASILVSLDEETGFVSLHDQDTDKVTRGKPAAMLRRLLYPMVAEAIPDTTFEAIANRLKAVAESTKGTIEIWDADRIPEAYAEENYADDTNTGTLYSCMRYDWAQKLMTWYKALGEGLVKIAVLVRNSDQKVLGRALVWNLPDGRIFMDRVYGSDSTRMMFRKYAKDQGWWKRAQDTFDYKQTWINPDTDQSEDVTVKIPVPRRKRVIRNVPYVDTFSYIDLEEGVIHNNGRHDWDGMLEVTRGRVEFNESRLWSRHSIETKEEFEEFFVNAGDVPVRDDEDDDAVETANPSRRTISPPIINHDHFGYDYRNARTSEPITYTPSGREHSRLTVAQISRLLEDSNPFG